MERIGDGGDVEADLYKIRVDVYFNFLSITSLSNVIGGIASSPRRLKGRNELANGISRRAFRLKLNKREILKLIIYN